MSELDLYRSPGVLTPAHLESLSPTDRATQLAQAFLASRANANTQAAYGKDLFLWFEFCRTLGLDVLAEPLPAHAELWYRWLAHEHPGLTWPVRLGADGQPTSKPQPVKAASPATAARRASGCAKFYRWLRQNGYSSCDPFTDTDRPKLDKSDPHGIALAPEQAAAMLDAVAADADGRASVKRNSAMLEVLFGNALRGGELTGLQTTDMGMHQGRRTLRVHGKGSKTRVLLLHSNVLAALNAYLAERVGATPGPLFTSSTGKPLDHKAVWRLVRRSAELAHQLRPELGMDQVARTIAPHDTRRTFITIGRSEGIELDRLAGDAGHASIETTRGYDRLATSFDRSAVIEIGDLIAKARQRPPEERTPEVSR